MKTIYADLLFEIDCMSKSKGNKRTLMQIIQIIAKDIERKDRKIEELEQRIIQIANSNDLIWARLEREGLKNGV